jgi:hypothetical protein
MHTNGLIDIEHLTRQRMDDVARRTGQQGFMPPPRRRALRRHTANRLRGLADMLER